MGAVVAVHLAVIGLPEAKEWRRCVMVFLLEATPMGSMRLCCPNMHWMKMISIGMTIILSYYPVVLTPSLA
jgi:hypothetical protein